ncbi:DUF3576 domain-containing protein [Nitrospirillum sp. BR 11164]|uniref:DUF3576 domain-containing protein n=1 Tax=Nitrospirillum sp. BR 11164 TaxID=3104324 RepID=UPI002AFEB67A|nr:DUF3576 domain-containing protein [Nitrospirillum sp. BR 11164]MEA1649621.1 DUF3576 domain-containing protein [Nitrospirillum sp. BR 11164]
MTLGDNHMPSRSAFLIGRSLLVAGLLLSTSACSWLGWGDDDDNAKAAPKPVSILMRQNTSGPVGTSNTAVQVVGPTVNAFLWRASLDTIGFLPLVSADPYTGVIITDWYSPPSTPGERFKINLYVLDSTLRADGVRVTVFRQVDQNGQWRDATVAAETNSQLEDTVLTRARQLRIQQAPPK